MNFFQCFLFFSICLDFRTEINFCSIINFKFESFEKSVELSRERQFLRSARKKIVGKIDKLTKIDKLFLLYFVATMTNE